MKKKNLAIVLGLGLLALGAGTASAGGSKGSLGVGGEYLIGTSGIGIGLGGLSVNYDLGEFHLGGFFAFTDGGDDDDTDVALGGRFFYHVHSTAMADFGVGGGVGIGILDDGNGTTDKETQMFIEPGIQVRAFVASNVALSFNAGLSIGVNDANGVAISAQPTGIAGFHYYFF